MVVFPLENLAFRLPWPPINISDLDKIHMFGRGLLKKHFNKTFVKISAVTQTIQNIVYVEANVMNICAKFQLHPPYGF